MRPSPPIKQPRELRLEFMPNGCWEARTHRAASMGYSMLNVKGQPTQLHRLIYEWLHKPIPVGLELDHLCRNRRCVNPCHLEPVTGQENVRRGNGFKGDAPCPRGHVGEFRVKATKRGHRLRQCRACARDHARESYRRS